MTGRPAGAYGRPDIHATERNTFSSLMVPLVCFSFISQGQAGEEKDHEPSDTDLKLEKPKVCPVF